MAGRAVASLFLLIGMMFSIVATPASACHDPPDFCLPCEGTGCGLIGYLHETQVLQSTTEELPVEFDGRTVASHVAANHRHATLNIILEWATDNHSAPPAAPDTPYRLRFTPGPDVAWDGPTILNVSLPTSERRVELAFPFNAPGDEDLVIDYVISSFPDSKDAQSLTGTLTIPGQDDGFRHVLFDHTWVALLVLAAGIVVGVVVALLFKPKP